MSAIESFIQRICIRPFLLVAVVVFCGCEPPGPPPVPGSGKMETEQHNLARFKSIELAVAAEVEIRQGEEDMNSFKITADDNLLRNFHAAVTGSTLKVHSEGSMSPSKPVKIVISAFEVESVSVTGAGTLKIDELAGDKTKLSIAGSADVETGVKSSSFACEIAGSGTISAKGTADSVAISIAGSGDIDTTALTANSVEINVAGGGTVKVHAEKALKVSVTGSGDISYSGSPEVTKTILGAGSVNPLPAGSVPPAGTGSGTDAPAEQPAEESPL